MGKKNFLLKGKKPRSCQPGWEETIHEEGISFLGEGLFWRLEKRENGLF